jgi:putative addiction module killer protein
MLAVVETVAFSGWISALKDARGRAKILARIERIRLSGHFGDCKNVGEGVRELRIPFGPGYRVYFCRRGSEVVVLLGGGDKGTLDRDIRAARALAGEV